MSIASLFLFVSIDGMTDPLGQSQVLPYLTGLAKQGYKIEIVSCEKRENWNLNHSNIEAITKNAGITWNYSFYKTGKPFISQLQNFLTLKKNVSKTIKATSLFTVLHCRSYLPGLIGLYCKKKFKTGFIFDMRGFWADERIEGGIWNKNNPIAFILYSYFKKKEKEMLLKADTIVTLTNKSKSIILNWNFGIESNTIFVIPCCVDLDHYSVSNIEPSRFDKIQAKYPTLKNKFVLSYIGSLGTWYMAEEMMDFFDQVSKKTDALFLIITTDDKKLVYEAAKKKNVSLDKLLVVSASKSEMPYYISMSTASVFFIRPTFSKFASSPTKMGELLSMKIPIITNNGVGDISDIINKTNCGVIINKFDIRAYEEAIEKLFTNIETHKANTLSTAQNYFSLNDGVKTYTQIYKPFTKQ